MAVIVAILDIRMEPLSNSKSSCCPDAFPRCLPSNFLSIQLTVQEQITTENFQDGHHGGHHGYDSDGDVENVKSY